MSACGKAALLLSLAVMSAGCWDFDQALAQCGQDGGRCAPSADSGGGGASAGGGSATGGGGNVSTGGGTTTGGGGNLSTGGGGGAGGGAPAGRWVLAHGVDGFGTVTATWAVSPRDVWFSVAEFPQFQLVHLQQGQFVKAARGAFNAWAITSTDAGLVVMAGEGELSLNIGRVLQVDAGVSWDGGDNVGALFAPTSSGLVEPLYAVFAAGSQIYASGANGSFYAAPSWADVPALKIAGASYASGGWGRADNDFWVTIVAPNQLMHRVGTSWALIVPSRTQLAGVFGTSSGAVWVVGNDGLIERVVADGGVTTYDAGSANWKGVWAWSDSEVFVVGEDPRAAQQGIVAHWDGVAFTRATVSGAGFASVHGLGPFDVWAGDADGGIWHFQP